MYILPGWSNLVLWVKYICILVTSKYIHLWLRCSLERWDWISSCLFNMCTQLSKANAEKNGLHSLSSCLLILHLLPFLYMALSYIHLFNPKRWSSAIHPFASTLISHFSVSHIRYTCKMHSKNFYFCFACNWWHSSHHHLTITTSLTGLCGSTVALNSTSSIHHQNYPPLKCDVYLIILLNPPVAAS